MEPATRRESRLFSMTRGILSGAAASALATVVLSYFADHITFGTAAYYVAGGRLIVHFPFEWARNEYSTEGGQQFPIDTDSLFGVVTYWLPDPRCASITWFSEYGYGWRGVESAWWGYWLHPLDTSTDGEYSETDARPVPLTFFVYATAIPCALMWWPRRRNVAGHCRGCGYDLRGLRRCQSDCVPCPECGGRAS